MHFELMLVSSWMDTEFFIESFCKMFSIECSNLFAIYLDVLSHEYVLYSFFKALIGCVQHKVIITIKMTVIIT